MGESRVESQEGLTAKLKEDGGFFAHEQAGDSLHLDVLKQDIMEMTRKIQEVDYKIAIISRDLALQFSVARGWLAAQAPPQHQGHWLVEANHVSHREAGQGRWPLHVCKRQLLQSSKPGWGQVQPLQSSEQTRARGLWSHFTAMVRSDGAELGSLFSRMRLEKRRSREREPRRGSRSPPQSRSLSRRSRT